MFDRCFPKRIAQLIERYEAVQLARAQDDDGRFAIDTPDVDIIRTLASDPGRTWALISADHRITRNPIERGVLDNAGIKFFCFGRAWFKMSFHDQAWKFLKAWPEVVETALNHRRRLFELDGPNLKIVPFG